MVSVGTYHLYKLLFIWGFYFSNWDLSGKRSDINFALSRRIVSSVSRESFMQNIGARNRADFARDVSVQTTGEFFIHGAKIAL